MFVKFRAQGFAAAALHLNFLVVPDGMLPVGVPGCVDIGFRWKEYKPLLTCASRVSAGR